MILVINAGSSNIKFALYEIGSLREVVRNQVSNLQQLYSWLSEQKNYAISAVGHRIVHGGMQFFKPTLIDSKILTELKTFIPLAPLHQPHNIAAIEFMLQEYPNVPQVACFDTAFHRTQLELAKKFAIPENLTAAGVIRYGFHGLSYEYIASVLQDKIGDIATKKVIVAHLGNGASMCAMQNLRSVATSMGFSALDGLMMGTRCGSIDPGVLLYLLQEQHYTVSELTDLLYNKCGLLGVSAESNDIRILQEKKSKSADEALALFCYRAAEEFCKLLAPLQGCDAIIFTGGIGENSAKIRNAICERLAWLGLKISSDNNTHNDTIINSQQSRVVAAVVPTNEEYMLAKHVMEITNVRK